MNMTDARPAPAVAAGPVRRRHDAFATLCQKAGHAVGRFKMIQEGDRILVGLSGGKDSFMLMHVLTRLRERAPVAFELVGVNIDFGFRGFRGEAFDAYCARQGWHYERIRFPGKEILEEKLPAARPCSLCSRLRRGQLHAAADRLGCNVIALGQHLDDLCVSFLMSLFRGGGLKTMGPHVLADGGRKRLIRPFCEAPERLIQEAVAAAAAGVGAADFGACDYLPAITQDGDRALLGQWLGDLDARFPAIRQAMLQSMASVQTEHLLDPRFLALPPEGAGGGEFFL
ncbi:MAG: ATP-binding protein [Lentisphaeria bacterium]|jgi:tRNA 2-thiocytidine biosynthesis protein TtcA